MIPDPDSRIDSGPATNVTLTKQQRQRVFWLSGSTCAGKSTISSMLAERLNWNVYHCDEWEDRQRAIADPERHPNWFAYSRLTGDPLWLMPVAEHVIQAERAYDEQFELILADIALLLATDERPLLYDGYASPAALAALVPSKNHAFYLISSEYFQRRHYEQRPWIHTVLAKTTNPEKAWENWMMRDVTGAQLLQDRVKTYQMPWLLVDGSVTVEETVERIAAHFCQT